MLLFIDSFDHYATADLMEKWSATQIAGAGAAVLIEASSGRRSGGCLACAYSSAPVTYALARKTLAPTGPTCIVGCAFQTDIAPDVSGTPILAVALGGVPHIVVVLLDDLRVEVRRGSGESLGVSTRGGDVIGISTHTLALGAYAYLECAVTIDGVNGSVEVRIDGVVALKVTGVTTREGSANVWDEVQIGIGGTTVNPGGPANECRYDDLYVNDGTGPAPWNTFLGDVRVDVRDVTGSGAASGWSPSSGGNYTNIDDPLPNNDSDYNSATTVGTLDLFPVEDVALAGAVLYGVQVSVSTRKLDAGACSVAAVTRQGSTDYVGVDQQPATGYLYGTQMWAANPATGAAWTEPDFNAAQFGYKKTL